MKFERVSRERRDLTGGNGENRDGFLRKTQFSLFAPVEV
jgi:hypothetical protein